MVICLWGWGSKAKTTIMYRSFSYIIKQALMSYFLDMWILCIIFIFIACVGVFGNTIVLFVIGLNKNLHDR